MLRLRREGDLIDISRGVFGIKSEPEMVAESDLLHHVGFIVHSSFLFGIIVVLHVIVDSTLIPITIITAVNLVVLIVVILHC
jgi:hypothetical protein